MNMPKLCIHRHNIFYINVDIRVLVCCHNMYAVSTLYVRTTKIARIRERLVLIQLYIIIYPAVALHTSTIILNSLSHTKPSEHSYMYDT